MEQISFGLAASEVRDFKLKPTSATREAVEKKLLPYEAARLLEVGRTRFIGLQLSLREISNGHSEHVLSKPKTQGSPQSLGAIKLYL